MTPTFSQLPTSTQSSILRKLEFLAYMQPVRIIRTGEWTRFLGAKFALRDYILFGPNQYYRRHFINSHLDSYHPSVRERLEREDEALLALMEGIVQCTL